MFDSIAIANGIWWEKSEMYRLLLELKTVSIMGFGWRFNVLYWPKQKEIEEEKKNELNSHTNRLVVNDEHFACVPSICHLIINFRYLRLNFNPGQNVWPINIGEHVEIKTINTHTHTQKRMARWIGIHHTQKNLWIAVAALSKNNTWSDLWEKDMKRAHNTLAAFFYILDSLIYCIQYGGVISRFTLLRIPFIKKLLKNGS